MDLVKVGQARDLLMKSERAKKALIDAFGRGSVASDVRSSLQLIADIAAFCEREEMELLLIDNVISSLMKEMKPSTEDIMKIFDILSQCQQDLKDYIIEKMHLSEPKSGEFVDYYEAISDFVRRKGKNEREIRKKWVADQVFQTPGVYVTLLAEILENKHGEVGFSVSSVLQYVNELFRERKVITIGGPQGRERYCFPHPSTIEDRSQFYHRLYATRGIVEEKVTNKFTLSKKFRDIFLINGVEKQLLLVVDYGKLRNIERHLILSYGDLEPFEYLVKVEGFAPRDQSLNMDILRARKVDRIVNGHEEQVWVDEKRADPYACSSVADVTAYSSVPSPNT